MGRHMQLVVRGTPPVAMTCASGSDLGPYAGEGFHDYHDTATSVLASSLAKRAPGYTSLGFPAPRRLTPTPGAPTVSAGNA